MSTAIRVLLNGKSADSIELRDTIYELRERGFSIDVRVTWEQQDIVRFVQEACNDGIERLIAAGGDGTLHETVNALMPCKKHSKIPSLGIIPMGTANDFSTSCDLPLSIHEALNFAVTAHTFPVDVIQVNKSYFLNLASSGFGASVTAATPAELKRILGGAAYSLMGVIMALNLKPHDGNITLPDEKNHKGYILVAAIGNGRQAGGGRILTPKAYIDDGLLDILLIRQFPVSDLGRVLQELSDLPEDGQYVSYIQTPWFDFTHQQAINVNLDGEPYSFKDGRAEVIPRALELILPSNCPLLSQSNSVNLI